MKTLSWSITLFALLIPAAAVAGPDGKFGTGDGTTPPLGSPEVLMCNTKLDSLVAAMKKPGNVGNVTAVSTIIVGGTTDSTAYAEGMLTPHAGEFAFLGGTAEPVFTGIVGTGELGALPDNKVYPLTFVIMNGLPSKAKLKWKFRSKNYESVVDSCEGGYWTSTAGNSTIANSTISIKLGPVKSGPEF
jgi:hypothetical protein